MNEQDFKKLFVTHKADIPDNGFSERIVRQLPERTNILPQIVMTVFIAIGLVLTFAIQGITPLLTQIGNLVTSISHLELPSLISVIAYFSVLGLVGIISFATVQVSKE